MQTWLPDADFLTTAKLLRDKELGRQRVDAKMAINALLFPERKSMWRFHPVCRMWKGYERSLIDYYETMVREWKRRGHKQTMELENGVWLKLRSKYLRRPWWLGKHAFHSAQQAALIRRDKAHYDKQFPHAWADEPPIWPVQRDGKRNQYLHPYGEVDSKFDLPF